MKAVMQVKISALKSDPRKTMCDRVSYRVGLIWWRRRRRRWVAVAVNQLNWLIDRLEFWMFRRSFSVCFFGSPLLFFRRWRYCIDSIRFHDNLKIICSHWRLLQCDFIFFSHESSHASEDICIEKWPAKNKVRSWFLLIFCVAVSQRFLTLEDAHVIFFLDCCCSSILIKRNGR